MQKSENIAELAKALSIVQSQLEGAKKDSVNPFFRSKYADLASVWDACRNLLGKNELAVVQTSSVIEGRDLVVNTTLMHSSGEWISGELAVPLPKNDPQGLGSALTYARRYGLSAMIGICPEDDDAESATPRKTEQKTTTKPSPEATRQTTDSVKSETNSNPQDKEKEAVKTEPLIDMKWLQTSLESINWADCGKYLREKYNVVGQTISEKVGKLNSLQADEFTREVKRRLVRLRIPTEATQNEDVTHRYR